MEQLKFISWIPNTNLFLIWWCNTSCNMIKIFYSKYTVACLASFTPPERTSMLTTATIHPETNICPGFILKCCSLFSLALLSSQSICPTHYASDKEKRWSVCLKWIHRAVMVFESSDSQLVWCHIERQPCGMRFLEFCETRSSVVQEEVVAALLLFHILKEKEIFLWTQALPILNYFGHVYVKRQIKHLKLSR